MTADLGGSIAQLLKAALAALVVLHFLFRLFKAGPQAKVPPAQARPLRRDPSQFRDEPPPPENPHLG